MGALIAATWSMPADTLSSIEAGLHPRLDYLDLAERLSAEWVDYDSAAEHPLLRYVEDRLRVDLRLAGEVAGRVRRKGHDKVVSLSERVGIPLASALGRGVKQTVILHHPMSRLKLDLLRYSGLHRAWDLMLCLSRAEADAFRCALHAGQDEVQVLNTPVDVEFYRPDATKISACDEAPHILSLGLSYRDYPTLIRAMRHLPEANCQIRAGSSWVYGQSGFEREQLPANVTTHPFVPPSDLRGIFQRCRFVVIPLQSGTQWSAGCTSVQIAQAMGKAVIATHLPGLEDYVAHEKTGLLVPAGDPAAMATAIERLWRNPEEADEMGRRGRRWIETEFTLDQWLDRLVALVEAH
ncbi:MAG TPA: glycosyltransferase family 4 protein [Anaerolineales bacterium]|nr:glycosyltransferase family 4 protein [Anaerolineales bacterium]